MSLQCSRCFCSSVPEWLALLVVLRSFPFILGNLASQPVHPLITCGNTVLKIAAC